MAHVSLCFLSTDFEDEGVDRLCAVPGWPRHGCSCKLYCVCVCVCVCGLLYDPVPLFVCVSSFLLSCLIIGSRERVSMFALCVCVSLITMFLYPSAAPVCISIRACVILLHVCAEENVAFLHQSAPLSFHVHQDSKAVCCLPLTSYTLVVFFVFFFPQVCVHVLEL